MSVMTHSNKRMQHGTALAIRLAAASLIAGLLVSCQPETDDGANLQLLEWNGYQHPNYYPEYMAKYGREPEYTFFAETEDALQRLRRGYPVELVHLCPGQMAEARDGGLIKPLDINRIPRWDNISPELLELEDVRADGEYWMVPWEWGYSVFAYNPETIDVENATYDIFIDPRFKGKTSLNSQIGTNLTLAGVIAGWENLHDPTDAEMDAAPEVFGKILENTRFVWTDATQLEQAWAAGDVGMSYVFGSGSRRMKQDGLPIVIIDPVMPWTCGLSVTTTGTGSEDRAYDYINAMLDPRSGVELFDVYGYGHANARSVDLIDPDRVAGTGIDDPAATFARGIPVRTLDPKKRARLLQLWFEAQAGLE